MPRARVIAVSAVLCLTAMALAGWAGMRRAAHPAPPPDPSWKTAWEPAAAEAAASGRPILADFTGSDWCPLCIKLHDEVFATPAFAAWARAHVVLLRIDFPVGKPLPPAEAAANDALAKRYGIDGFPTVLILDQAGGERARLLYEPGGPGPWLAKAEAALARAPATAH